MARRPGRSQIAVAVLCGSLAFAMVTQVHTASGSTAVAAARPQDLLAILSDLQGRADRLRSQVGDLQAVENRLQSGSATSGEALAEARRRAATLGILTGTVAARGPGVVVTIDDPRATVRADVLVDTLEELRDAGAEAIQLSGVRVVAQTAVVDRGRGSVAVDGTVVRAPYRVAAIGDPHTLATALEIPGGVVDTVAAAPGAHAHVQTSPSITVAALRRLTPPRYARPAPSGAP